MVLRRRDVLDQARLFFRSAEYERIRATIADAFAQAAKGTSTEALALEELDRCAALLLEDALPPQSRGRCNLHDPASDEVYYWRTYAHYLTGALAEAHALARDYKPLTPYYRAALPLLRSWIFAASGELPQQMALLIKTLRGLLDEPDGDMHLIGNACYAIAALAREMPSAVVRELLERALARLRDAEEASTIFHVRRALAMIDALHGRAPKAIAQLTQATQYAKSPVDHAFLQFDYALIAGWANQKVVAHAAFDVGYEIVQRLGRELENPNGESVFVLTVGAAAGAALNIEAAATLARTAARLMPKMSSRWRVAAGVRSQALVTEALVLTRSELDPREAEAAMDTFERIGYSWRAGRLGLALFQQTGSPGYRQRALRLLAAYSEGPFGLGEEQSEEAKLSPRKRDILRLLQAGYAPKAIASELGIALLTVRTHISQLHTIYRASRQGELLAKAPSIAS